MAHIPSFEETLSQIRQSLGLERHPQEKRFSGFDLNLENHINMSIKIIEDIFNTLDMDELDCEDAFRNIMEWGNFNKALELKVWTGNASQQQVLWHMLAYSYVPHFARRLAFWSIANIQNSLPPIDAGMPGGIFWFLPNPDKNNTRLEMPVEQVINWLLDLLGEKSVYTLKGSIGAKSKRENDESTFKTLKNWRENKLPKNAKKIDALFPDDASLNFKGTISIDDTLQLKEKLDITLSFVKSKGLDNAEALHLEIPMTVARLEAIFNGDAPDEEKEDFVKHISTRYAEPAMSTIRQRLKVARMMQDGYQRLLKFLCPDVDKSCTDPASNKLLQLISLFQTVYNLTIEAWKNEDAVAAQDRYFESRLAPWDKLDLLHSILPSQHENSNLLLAKLLTRKFISLETGSPIMDLVPWDTEHASPIVKRRLLNIKQQLNEDEQLEKLHERLRIASPWRALLEVDSFWVLSQLAGQDNLSEKIQDMTLKRMRELADTEGQKVMVNLVELGFLLNSAPKFRPKNIKHRVQQLLDESEQSSGYEEWNAPLLRFRAKHYLFQNNFGKAITYFKESLAACSERAFGGLRGEIARDGFATELAENGFIPQNQEIYYRNMLGYMAFANGTPSLENSAVECEEFFWDTLYQPYSDVEHMARKSRLQYEAFIKETFGLVYKADWDGFRVWLQKNAKNLRNKNIKEARRNSVLLSWLKLMNSFEKPLPQLKARTSFELWGEVDKVELFMKNWRVAIQLLLETWPEQAIISDFKGQTPLMLVADNDDTVLTKLLAPLSDINAQDFFGRTALHAAVTGRSAVCVSIVLECNPLVCDKITFDEKNTALHTAVRLGSPEIVSLILDEFPALANQVNDTNQTPLAMAQDISDNFPDWRKFMYKQNRQIGSKEDFIDIVTILRAASISMH